MFNIGSGEIALIAVVALLVLGPSRLPELARGIGKFLREFRRQTDDVRGMVEREFYKMDSELSIHEPPLAVRPASDSVASGASVEPDVLPAPAEEVHSQVTQGAPSAEPVAPPVEPQSEETKS